MPIGTRSSLMKNYKGMVGIDSTSKVAYINGPIRPSEDTVGLRVTHRGTQILDRARDVKDMLLGTPML
ncbi:hypothetical protein KY285_024021 [Solanum tuberosum]|nr:hypothetical protein KY289_024377 [Solanum tuberosum]KAH0676220.1 hypothetical protein KY285_024021 [Solanum tuberosum]